MQLKTSCCNKAVVRKDLTRFAPVWGLYTLALLLGIFLMVDEDRYFSYGVMLTNLPQVMAVVNLGYALLVAQLLFGDLYNSRSCYALHAMPLRRETWLCSHLVSGLIMSLVPTFVMSLMATLLTFGNAVDRAWLLPWYGFAAANLQYLFFFGLATLCSFAAGNRLGMIACYGAVNFFAFAVAVVAEFLYSPMLFGIVYDGQAYLPYAPVLQMSGLNMLDIPDYHDLLSVWEKADRAFDLHMNFIVGEGWGYVSLMALLGVGMMGLSLLMYRRRQLEVAGDLLAVKALEPVFQILVAVACAYGFQFVHDQVTGATYNLQMTASTATFLKSHGWFLFMAVGLVVGWFVAKMLLERSTRVFRKRSLPGIAVLALALVLTFVATAVDPLGIEIWMPDPDEVASVAVAEDAYYNAAKLDRPGDLDKIMELHSLALNERVTCEALNNGATADRNYDQICLEYRMKNGDVVKRRYYFWVDGETAKAAEPILSRPEVVLTGYREAFDFSQMDQIGFQHEYKNITFRDKADLDSFVAALRADCEAGTMAQGYYYHRNVGYFQDPQDERRLDGEIGVSMYAPMDYLCVRIYPECKNTMAWLRDHQVLETMNYEIAEGDYFTQSEYISTKYQDEALG